MGLTGHEIGVLKGYMEDLVDQARQEAFSLVFKKYFKGDYTFDDALMDLLMTLDDRGESEGAMEGLSEDFPHHMWGICNHARGYVKEMVWFSSSMGPPLGKTGIRKVAYSALIDFIETKLGEKKKEVDS